MFRLVPKAAFVSSLANACISVAQVLDATMCTAIRRYGYMFLMIASCCVVPMFFGFVGGALNLQLLLCMICFYRVFSFLVVLLESLRSFAVKL